MPSYYTDFWQKTDLCANLIIFLQFLYIFIEICKLIGCVKRSFFGKKKKKKGLDAFAKVMRVTNSTGLWKAGIAWYSLSATHQICLNGLEQFKSMVLGMHDLQPRWNFTNHAVNVLGSTVLSPFISQMFLAASKVLWPNLNLSSISSQIRTVACSSAQLSNYTWSEVMQNMSLNQLTWYYQAQQVLFMAWTAPVTWYTCCKLACTKILQKFLFTLVVTVTPPPTPF